MRPLRRENKAGPCRRTTTRSRNSRAGFAERVGTGAAPDGSLTRPPALQGGQPRGLPDLLRFVRKLVQTCESPRARRAPPAEVPGLATLCRQAKFDAVKGERLEELLHLLTNNVDLETPVTADEVRTPKLGGARTVRQAARSTRARTTGRIGAAPEKGRLALLGAPWRFARGRGPVPRMHHWLPETTFEQLEQPIGHSIRSPRGAGALLHDQGGVDAVLRAPSSGCHSGRV